MTSLALNHVTAPRLSTEGLLRLAQQLGCAGVELRNDLDTPLFSGMSPEDVKKLAEENGVEILALAEVKAFNDDCDSKLCLASELMDLANRCGASAIALIPRVGGDTINRQAQKAKLRVALEAFMPLLESRDLVGLVEPIGFSNSTLRYKEDTVEVIDSLNARHCFKLVHDSFHHRLAGEELIFAQQTGVVHISGVLDAELTRDELQDGHRGLVSENDSLGTMEQLGFLAQQGYTGPVSYEVFAPDVHALPDLKEQLGKSIQFVTSFSEQTVRLETG